jgi:glucokinase
MLLAGDIGGTKTLLALYQPGSDARKPIAEAEFASSNYPGLEEMVGEFLGQVKRTAAYACFDVAGPVIEGRARLTNLPWSLEEETLGRNLGLKKVILLNDLKAIAYAVTRLQPMDLQVINPGKPVLHGTIAVVAPGTGLGEAFLVWSGKDYIACSSEGGHADFGPADEMQAELWHYAAQQYGHVSWERVCSGLGIATIYDFLRDRGYASEAPEFAARLADAADRTPLIVEAGLAEPLTNPLAAATLQMFVAILGAEAGNMALKVLATGGVYLAGGMPKRILPLLKNGRFMEAFSAKGRLSEMVKDIPVRVIISRAALLGAVFYGFDHFWGL